MVFNSAAPIIVSAKSFASRPHFRIANRTTTKYRACGQRPGGSEKREPTHDRGQRWRSKLVNGSPCCFVKLARITFKDFVSQPAKENKRADRSRQTKQK